jgi:hypothetical protein
MCVYSCVCTHVCVLMCVYSCVCTHVCTHVCVIVPLPVLPQAHPSCTAQLCGVGCTVAGCMHVDVISCSRVLHVQGRGCGSPVVCGGQEVVRVPAPDGQRDA